MVCSVEPVEQLLLNKILCGVTGNSSGFAQTTRALHSFCLSRDASRSQIGSGIECSATIHKKIAEAWMELVERWGLRLDLQIGQAWLSAGSPVFPFLLLRFKMLGMHGT